MKFGEKYELLESLTTGGVETFVANDKVRGERVLVHILECEGQKPNQPTVQWVLEAFRRIAPEPAGTVERFTPTLSLKCQSKPRWPIGCGCTRVKDAIPKKFQSLPANRRRGARLRPRTLHLRSLRQRPERSLSCFGSWTRRRHRPRPAFLRNRWSNRRSLLPM
jgi:hypothetical protein